MDKSGRARSGGKECATHTDIQTAVGITEGLTKEQTQEFGLEIRAFPKERGSKERKG